MMKKFMILLLVLGMASVANATAVFGDLELSFNGTTNGPGVQMVIEVTPSTNFVIDVHSLSDDVAYDAIINTFDFGSAMHTTPTTMTIITAGTTIVDSQAGTAAVASAAAPPGGVSLTAAGSSTDTPTPFGSIDPGQHFSWNVHCTGEGWVVVELTDLAFGIVHDTMLIKQIPEPMTIALLGLGGLFLRRRK